MRFMSSGCVLFWCAAAATAGWGEAQSESGERFVCTFGASQRLVDIYRLAAPGARGGGCRVDYTKGGITKTLWSSRGDYAFCVRQGVGLVTTLTKGHFSCKPQTTPERHDIPGGARGA